MRAKIKPLRSLVSLLLLAGLSVEPAQARTFDAIKVSGTLRVGLTGDYAPYSLHIRACSARLPWPSRSIISTRPIG
jgi:ABC-type amino acid transport substrate-binding protein